MNLTEARIKYARLQEEQKHYDVYGYTIISNVLNNARNEQEALETLQHLYKPHFPNDRLGMGYTQAIDDLQATDNKNIRQENP